MAMKRSLVMVEWARNNEPTHEKREDFVWHQILLSLLYDEVVVQDEILLCSKKLARWFARQESFDLLTKVFECGGLGVLKRPWARYPEELQQRVVTQPLSTRRDFLERFSVDNNGMQLTFSSSQLALHSKLEAFLQEQPSLHRFAGERRGKGTNLMDEFRRLLIEVLINPSYGKWMRRTFPNITPEIAIDFSRLIEEMELAERRLKSGSSPLQRLSFGESPLGTFNTAIAVALAATYPQRVSSELQSLIETVFARPFCQEEQSEGRYGRSLRDLPLTSEIGEDGKIPDMHVAHVETISLRLPKLSADLPEIVNSVRESRSGRRLREVMRDLGADPTFAPAVGAWRDVADDLASSISANEMKEFSIRALIGETPRGTVCGFLAGLTATPLAGHGAPSMIEAGIGAGLGSILDVSGNILGRYLRTEQRRQALEVPLREAVQFSCVRHPAVAQVVDR